MFRQAAILCLIASAVLSAPTDVVPLEKQQPTVIPIISQSEELEPNGTYKFSYETGNGIKREEISFDKIVPKVRGQSDASNEGGEDGESEEIHVQQGSYSYTAPDGTVITVRYIADENGFQAFGDHLPRAPAPVQISSILSEKSGRALKKVDSAEVASAPVSVVKPKPTSETVNPSEEAEQSVPETLTKASAPDSPADKVSEDETKISADAAVSEQPAPVENPEVSGITVTSDQLNKVAEQSSTPSLIDQSSTVGTEQSSTDVVQPSTTAIEESSTVAAEQPSTVAAEPTSTVTVEQPSTVAAEQPSTAAAEQPSTVAAEQPGTVAAEQPSTVAAEQPSTVAADELATAAQQAPADEEPAITANAETSVNNAPIEQQSTTSADDLLSSTTNNQLRLAADKESSAPASANPTDQSSSISESEQPSSTQSVVPSEDATTTVSV